jgi:hypothetical protein
VTGKRAAKILGVNVAGSTNLATKGSSPLVTAFVRGADAPSSNTDDALKRVVPAVEFKI